jgi:hypothetical protein
MGTEKKKKKKTGEKNNDEPREADCRMGKTGGDVLYTVVVLPIKCGALVQWQKGKKKNMTCNDNWLGRHSGLGRRDCLLIIQWLYTPGDPYKVNGISTLSSY